MMFNCSSCAEPCAFTSGNSTIEGAINWLSEHQEDADIDEMPLVWWYFFSTYLCSLFLSLLWWCYLIPIWKVQCSWYIVSCYYVSIRTCFIEVVLLTCFIIVPMLYSWNLCKQLVWSKLICPGWCFIALPKFVYMHN